MTLTKIQQARRIVRARIVPFRAVLGDANNNPYGDDGFYWVRRLDRADANNLATTGAAFQVRAGSGLIVPRGGRVVWIKQGNDGHLTIDGFDHADLLAAGIDARSAQPNDPYRQWIRFKDLQNFRALPLATGSAPSLKVQVRQLFYYTETGALVRFNGTNASTHPDVTDYVPVDGLQRYVVLWLRTYDPQGLGDIQVTYSSTISSIEADLSFTELQECADQADADTIPIQAFRLANAQTTLKIDDTLDTDLRQFINMPQVFGFPNTVTRAYRVHEYWSVIAPSAIEVQTGGVIIVEDNAVLVIQSYDETDEGGGDTGGGAPTTATYLLQTANGSLPNAQAMGALATGIVKNTTTTGVVSIAVEGTDYSLLPVVDTTSIVRGSADGTKRLRIEVDGFTTGTTRVATFPNADLTVVGETTSQNITNKAIDASTIGVSTPNYGAFTTLIGSPLSGSVPLFISASTDSAVGINVDTGDFTDDAVFEVRGSSTQFAIPAPVLGGNLSGIVPTDSGGQIFSSASEALNYYSLTEEQWIDLSNVIHSANYRKTWAIIGAGAFLSGMGCVPTANAVTQGNTADGAFSNYATAASINASNVAGTTTFDYTRTAFYPRIDIVLNVVSTTDIRLWVGLFSATANNSDTLTGTTNGFGWRFSSTTDSGFVPFTHDGSSGQTMGTAHAAIATGKVVLTAFVEPATNNITFVFNGDYANAQTIATTLPVTTTNLGLEVREYTKANVAKTFGIGEAMCRQR